jgi:hypothetical protein
MDETYIRSADNGSTCIGRSIRQAGRRFLPEPKTGCECGQKLSPHGDEEHRKPAKITLDAYAASHRAVREMKEEGKLPRRVQVRSSQYLNNLVEQDHRRVKQRIRPMLGSKRFDHAVVTISGIELAEKIKKGQFTTGKLGGPKATMSALWNAALAA